MLRVTLRACHDQKLTTKLHYVIVNRQSMPRAKKQPVSRMSPVAESSDDVIDIEELAEARVRAKGAHTVVYHQLTGDEVKSIRKSLLAWFDCHKRQMPWRKDIDHAKASTEELAQRAYEVWVSECMLQQTQVATVVAYYNRWLENWPTVQALANASLDDVNKAWAGLGYYSRARRLHEGARIVVEQHDGHLPCNAADLEKLIPGVGRYTAGAIASIAYNQAVPLVDGNVIRVLSRLRALGGNPKDKEFVETVWDFADALVDSSRPGDFNQSLMELGATVCTPTNPQCDTCPVSKNCLAYHELLSRKRVAQSSLAPDERHIALQSSSSDKQCSLCIPYDPKAPLIIDYPKKIQKASAREEETYVCIVERETDAGPQYLLIQRPEKGLLAGLWQFPCLPPRDPSESIALTELRLKMGDYLKSEFGMSFENECWRSLGTIVHLFSHIRMTYRVCHLKLQRADGDETQRANSGGLPYKWVPKDKIDQEAIPTGLKKVYALLSKPATIKTESGKQKSVKDFFKKVDPHVTVQ